MSCPLPTREEIVACLDEASRPLHAGGVGKRLGVPRESYPTLLELLEQLTLEGTIESAGGKRFRATTSRRISGESWVGELTMTARGFGFVNCSGKPDVYIPPEAVGPSLHGDTVRIEVVQKSSRGVEGRIAEVVRRRNPRVAGVVRIKRTSAWLEPDDDRLRGPVVLHDGFEDCKDGSSGVVKITRFPIDSDENPEGRLVAVLGPPGSPVAEVAKIKIREQIEEEHPPAAMQEAEAVAMRARKLQLGKRRDLRKIPFLTIDPADARDHDDAVWVGKTDAGYRAYIAIADVAEYVQPGTALDEEARARGCTIYLPDRAIPMLPGSLAADLCSLLPDRERYCLCVIADLDANGKVKRTQVVEGLMRAAAMITYGSAARTLGFTDKGAKSPLAESFKKDLKVLASLSTKLRRARMKRGALDLNLPEPQVVLDEENSPVNVTRRAQDPGMKRAYQMVEEMMLLANECVARWLGRKKSPSIYRVHGKPDEEKLGRLVALAETLGLKLDPEQLQSPLGVSQWLKKIQKHELSTVLESLLLRSLKQAIYDTVNIGHFGLASDAYLHFTSPIRRYPDLLVHRTIKHLARGGSPSTDEEALEVLREAATTSSTRERAAVKVEREVVDLYRALYMQSRVGEIFEGKVTAVVGSGLFVALSEPFVEVKVTFESLGPDHYDLSEDELSIVGRRSGEQICLGQTLTVEIEDVSVLRRQVLGSRIAFGTDLPPPSRSRPQSGRGRTGKPGDTGFRRSRPARASSQNRSKGTRRR